MNTRETYQTLARLRCHIVVVLMQLGMSPLFVAPNQLAIERDGQRPTRQRQTRQTCKNEAAIPLS